MHHIEKKMLALYDKVSAANVCEWDIYLYRILREHRSATLLCNDANSNPVQCMLERKGTLLKKYKYLHMTLTLKG